MNFILDHQVNHKEIPWRRQKHFGLLCNSTFMPHQRTEVPYLLYFRMLFLLIFIGLYLVWPQLVYSYDQDVSIWQEVTRSRTPMSGNRMVWSNAANRSEYEWKVLKEGHTVKAVFDDAKRSHEKPPFTPHAENFQNSYPYASLKVDDGWLIGFNQGEFGRALYWFDHSGQSRYKISNHQVVAFFPSSDGILGIEGLAHLSSSHGSIIRLARSHRWQAEKLTLLPEAPYAGVQFRDGRLLLVLSSSLAEYSRIGDREILRFVEKDGDWGGLYPNSVVLTDDQTKAYIGMRQYVAEYHFERRTLRFLIPNSSFLNTLNADEEQDIKRLYGPP